MRSRAYHAIVCLGLGLGCLSIPDAPVVSAWNAGTPIELDAFDREILEEANEFLRELESEDEFFQDAAFDAYLADVLHRVVPPLSDGAPVLRARVVRTAARNGMALPNGEVLLSLGLLASISDEAELAALLAHEGAHIVFRHSRIAREYRTLTASTVDRMGVSRDLEWAADAASLDWIVKAGYAPMALSDMLDHLDADYAWPRVRAWESHPDLGERRRATRRRAAFLDLDGLSRGKDRYEAVIVHLLPMAIEVELEGSSLERARAASDRLVELQPGEGRSYFLRAEVARRTHSEGSAAPEVRKAYERAIELSPDHTKSVRALAFLLHKQGIEPDRTRALFQHYLALEPKAVDRILIERYLAD